MFSSPLAAARRPKTPARQRIIGFAASEVACTKSQSDPVLLAKSDELVFRIGPGDRRHVGLFVGMQLQVIGPPISVYDQIGDEIGARRLDENMNALCCAGAALRIANDPAHGVASRDGSGANKLLARLEGDVGDLAGRGVDLVERAVGER